ncbi:hypothetical protein VNO77_19196 [Canavalia gladiata]|uniref:Uncharacterized protein n=1 Tax=Canavalia gladiata TaxID=3824 RepID=A0AAN9LMA2_CANGL
MWGIRLLNKRLAWWLVRPQRTPRPVFESRTPQILIFDSSPLWRLLLHVRSPGAYWHMRSTCYQEGGRLGRVNDLGLNSLFCPATKARAATMVDL